VPLDTCSKCDNTCVWYMPQISCAYHLNRASQTHYPGKRAGWRGEAPEHDGRRAAPARRGDSPLAGPPPRPTTQPPDPGRCSADTRAASGEPPHAAPPRQAAGRAPLTYVAALPCCDR